MLINQRKEISKMKKKIFIFIIINILFILLCLYNNTVFATENNECVYLSDISYVQDKSFASPNHTIHLDENDSKNIITLKVNNTATSFIKGICSWATSEIVYDLSAYNFDYFSSYLGVDISEQSDYFNGGAKFYIYTSSDGENWDEQYHSNVLYGWSEAQFVKINIKNAHYLKLVADDNGDINKQYWVNWYDETIFADAKLTKETYIEDTSTIDFIKTVDEYDSIINNNYNQPISGDYELTVLQREFVNSADYNVLQALAKYKTEYKETLNWLMSNKDILKLYLVAGKPEGSYLNSIKVLSDLYHTYGADLENTTKTEYGTTLGDLYLKMMLSLSLTESRKCIFVDRWC